MEVRLVAPEDDFEAIGHIYASSWQAAYRGIVPQDYLDTLSAERWGPRLAARQYPAVVILDGSRYVGTSSVCAARDEGMPGWGEIISLYLLPEYFGKGYGQPLFEAAVQALEGMGYQNIYLWVLKDNLRAQKFYKKQGFAPNGDTTEHTIGGKALTELRYVKHP